MESEDSCHQGSTPSALLASLYFACGCCLSTYPPQGNSRGEVHEHWSFFSYDRARKILVLRQFHQEGFVNRYTLNQEMSKPGKLVFESEQFESGEPKKRMRSLQR